MNELEKMKEALDEAFTDAQKFYNKNNNAAGTRLRKKMQEIKALAQGVRNSVIDVRNSR